MIAVSAPEAAPPAVARSRRHTRDARPHRDCVYGGADAKGTFNRQIRDHQETVGDGEAQRGASPYQTLGQSDCECAVHD